MLICIIYIYNTYIYIYIYILGSRFVILENKTYEENVQHKTDRSSFKELKDDPSKLFQEKVNNWIEK